MFSHPQISSEPFDFTYLIDDSIPLEWRLDCIQTAPVASFNERLKTSGDGTTVFHALVCREYQDKLTIVRAILDKRVALNTTNSFGDTPLILLALRNDLPMIRLLLEYTGVDTVWKNKRGDDAISILQQFVMSSKLRDSFLHPPKNGIEQIPPIIKKDEWVHPYRARGVTKRCYKPQESIDLIMQYSQQETSTLNAPPADKEAQKIKVENEIIATPTKSLIPQRDQLDPSILDTILDLDPISRLVALTKLEIRFHNKTEPANDAAEEQLFRDVVNKLFARHLQSVTEEVAQHRIDGIDGENVRVQYILFLPKVEHDKKIPLIIHSHGGPNVCMTKDKLHAQITHFISQGIAVACPNYRGSKPAPFPEGAVWEDSYDMAFQYVAIHDIYAVTQDVLQKHPVLDKGRVMLRGGSFGSHLNAHLLAQIKAGVLPQLYCGVHLFGGLDYPLPHEFPTDIPILLSHGMQDKITPCLPVKLLAEKSLQRKLFEDLADNNLEIDFVKNGDHHLVPDFELILAGNESRIADLTSTLSKLHLFVEHVFNHSFQASDPYSQLCIIAQQFSESIGSVTAKAKAFAYTASLPISAGLNFEKRVAAADPINAVKEMKIDRPTMQDNSLLTPTLAHLSIILGYKFVGEIRADLTNFLLNHFAPKVWEDEERKPDLHVGKRMVKDSKFFEQLVAMIEKEQTFLTQNPHHVVLYHATTHQGLLIYAIVNTWRAILQEKIMAKWEELPDMRFSELVLDSFECIENFLRRMDQLKKDNGEHYNYTEGFAERAIACNPMLTGNSYCTASCSLFWYYHGSSIPKDLCDTAIDDILTTLGLTGQGHKERYVALVQSELGRLIGRENQSAMQQIFLPKDVANRYGMLSQFGGTRFKKVDPWETPYCTNIEKLEILVNLTRNPQGFENVLRRHRNAFTNPEKFDDFPKWNHFTHTDILQVRMLTNAVKQHGTVFTYLRNSAQFQTFIGKLNALNRETYGDYLASGVKVADQDCRGVHRKSTETRLKLGFIRDQQIAEPRALQQQLMLRKRLIDNPSEMVHANFLDGYSKERKTKIQEKLGNLREIKHTPYLYCLCAYLKGYTYYDLVKEIINQVLLQKVGLPHIDRDSAGLYQFCLNFLNIYAKPGAIYTHPIQGGEFTLFNRIMYACLQQFEISVKKDDLFYPPDCTLSPNELLMLDITAALNSVLHHAKLAKQYSDGDLEQREAELCL